MTAREIQVGTVGARPAQREGVARELGGLGGPACC